MNTARLLSPRVDADRRQAARYYALYRVILAGFAAIMVYANLQGLPTGIQTTWPELVVLAYVFLAIALLLYHRHGMLLTDTWLLGGFICDAALIIGLANYSDTLGPEGNVLLVTTVGASTIVLRARLSFFIAAIGSLALLAGQTLVPLLAGEDPSELPQAGMLGVTLFATAWIGNHLARRVSQSRHLAERRGQDIASLERINELIVRNLQAGVILLDEQCRVRMFNADADAALGGDLKTGQALSEQSSLLAQRWQQWLAQPEQFQPPGSFAAKAPVVLPRFVPLAARSDGSVSTLVFLEDTAAFARHADEVSLAGVGRLGASIAHEIRNPLGAISHAAQLLHESDQLATDDRSLVDMIVNHADRMNQLIENLLDLSRRRPPTPTDVDLDELLTSLQEQRLADNRNCHIDIMLPSADEEAAPPLVDRAHLTQALNSLIDNAQAHVTNDCHITLVDDYDQDRRQHTVIVRDNGPGVPSELQEKIFEPFFSTRQGGHGLGLFVIHNLCAANRIQISYHEAPGGGAEFHLDLPPRPRPIRPNPEQEKSP